MYELHAVFYSQGCLTLVQIAMGPLTTLISAAAVGRSANRGHRHCELYPAGALCVNGSAAAMPLHEP